MIYFNLKISIFKFIINLQKMLIFIAVRATICRGLSSKRIHIPFPADAAIRKRSESSSFKLSTQRMEL